MEDAKKPLTPELQKLLDTITGRVNIYERKCLLCKTSFSTSVKTREFHSDNCRVKYWTLKKELGEKELTERINYLVEQGELPL